MELVLVAHADDLAEAERYKTELASRGIPVVLEGSAEAGATDAAAGVPVLVPEALADEAAELMAELESTKTEGIPLDPKDDIFDEEGDELEDLDELEDEDAGEQGLDGEEEDDAEEDDEDEEEEDPVDEEELEEEEDEDEEEDDEWEEDEEDDDEDEEADEDDEDWEEEDEDEADDDDE
jgi:hypothetical protein